MENLILYGYSGFNSIERKEITKIAHGLPDCGLVLMQDAVFGTNEAGNFVYEELLSCCSKIFCLKEDALARGMKEAEICPKMEIIDYGKLIDLMESSNRLISWL